MGTAMATAQLAEQPAVDLKAGLIISPPGSINLLKDKDGLPGAEDFAQPVELSDYTFSFDMAFEDDPGEGGDHPLRFAAIRVGSTDLCLAVSPERKFLLEDPDYNLTVASAGPTKAGQKTSVAVSVKRDAKQALSSWWVDGVEQAAFPVAPGKGALEALVVGGMELRAGIVSNIRLYNRALARPEIIALSQCTAAQAWRAAG